MADAIEQSLLLAAQTTSDGLRTATNVGYGQAGRFTPKVSGFLQQLDLSLQKNGAPTGAITVGIYLDSGGFPLGAQVGGFPADVDPSTVQVVQPPTTYTSFVWTTSKPYLTAGTQYWFVLTGNYTPSATDFIAIWFAPIASYAAGKSAKFGSSWVADTTKMPVFREWIGVGGVAHIGKKAQTSIQVGVKK